MSWYWEETLGTNQEMSKSFQTKPEQLACCSVMNHNPDKLDCEDLLYSFQLSKINASEGIFKKGHHVHWRERCPIITTLLTTFIL